MATYRMAITGIWWGLGLFILIAFFWFAMNPENFGDHRGRAIDWLLPHLLPTMTLTGAVAYSTPMRNEAQRDNQIRFAFILTCVVSVVYLLLLAGIVINALTGTGVETSCGAVDTLLSWNKVLGVMQGLAASAIGVFFVRSDSQ